MSDTQFRRWYARNALVGLGVALLVGIAILAVVASNPIEARLVQIAFPGVIAFGLIAYGRKHHRTLQRAPIRPFLEWVVATILYFVFVGVWFFVLSRTLDTSIPIAIATSVATGLGLGALIGVYALRVHEAKDDLVRANEELSGFASIVSHDLRNPVQVASGSLELLATELSPDDPNVERIEYSLDRIETIIENVLVLTRGAGILENVRVVDVGDVAMEAWRTTDAPRATLELDDPPRTRAAPDLLATLLENCFRNASDHSDGPVTVTVGELDDDDGFYVADDGPGIPVDAREDVFEMGESGSGGTGIGLFVVGRVATVHGWRYVATESASGGARFEFYT